MSRRPVSRRRFLAGASAGGAALALGSAAAAAPVRQRSGISPQVVEELAQYADVPLAPDRAAELAPLLAGALAQLRALPTQGYENLEPAVVFRVPPEG